MSIRDDLGAHMADLAGNDGAFTILICMHPLMLYRVIACNESRRKGNGTQQNVGLGLELPLAQATET